MSKLLKWYSAALIGSMMLPLFGQGELFKVDFDNFNVTAGYSKGSPISTSFRNPDLQLRMFPGPGKEEQNGICLENTEYLAYPLKGNMDTKQGTVSFWCSPRNWKLSDAGPQVFFTANRYAKDHHFSMLLYKYNKNTISFYYEFKMPGDKKVKRLIATANVSDAQWKKDSWHKLDAVWDQWGLKLYIDGKLAAERKFRTNEKILLPSFEDGQFMLGTDFKWKGMNRSALTGYDNFVIYARCLSAAEIRRGYESIFPTVKTHVKLQPPVITLPLQKKQIKLDGKISAGEWSDAAKTLIDRLYPRSANRKYGKSAQVWMKYDQNNIYIAMKSERPPARKIAVLRDSKVWQDDCFEVHVTPDKGNYMYQYVINANNAIFDFALHKIPDAGHNRGWNGTAQTAVDVQNDSWTAELIIPFKDAGLKAGDKMWLNFAYLNCQNGNNQYSWGAVDMQEPFGSPKCAGQVIYGKQGEGVRLETLGNIFQGKLNLKINAIDSAKNTKIKTKVALMPEGSASAIQSENITGIEWKQSLPAGKHKLEWESSIGKKIIARGVHEFEISTPLEITYECHGEKHYADIFLNMNNAGEQILKKIFSNGVRGKLSLMSDSGKVIATKDFIAKNNAHVKFRFSLPHAIKSGTYQFRAELDIPEKLCSTADFVVPDLTPYKAKVAVDHTVPTPWVKVEKVKNGVWRVLNRTFTFDKGPLPVSIINEGDEMFDRAPEYKLVTGNGDAVIRWSDFTIGRNHGDYVELSGKGQGGGLQFMWNGELWFDGTYKWTLDFTPQNVPVTIKRFCINWTMPAEFSKYVLHPLFVPWGKDGTIRLRWEPVPEENTMCWVLGHRRGISWWNESNANWNNKQDEKQILLKRSKDGRTLVNIAMISVPAVLKSKAFYTMTLTATPLRPLDNKVRDYEFYGKDSELRFEHEVRTTSGNSHLALNHENYRKALKKAVQKGTKHMIYACPFYLDDCDAHHDYFYHDWKKSPVYMWGTRNFANGSVPSMAKSVCAGSNLFDLYAWRQEQLFKDFPDLAGVYYDCCHCPECNNAEHGCSIKDAFGKISTLNTAWKLRGNLIRSLKIHRKYNRTLVLHGHNKFNPIAHGFGDYWWPGEEYATYQNGMSPVFIYCDMQDEWLQSSYNSEIRGNGIIILPQPTRGVQYGKGIRERIMKDGGWTLATWAHMTPFLLHGTNLCWVHLKDRKLIEKWWKIKSFIKIGEAEFVGYWFRNVITTNAPRVYASWYKWKESSSAPYKRVIIIGNLNREKKNFKVTIDREALGIGNRKVAFVDLWNNKPIAEKDFDNMTLDAARFIAIGVKYLQ